MTERKIFLDTETTGLSSYSNRIIEIAAVEVDEHFQPIRIFHEYLDPKQTVGRSYEVHGISDSFLRGRKEFKDIANEFMKFVRGATVYAHNMSFDKSFIDMELQRCGQPSLCSFTKPVDTLPIARRIIGGRASLDRLISYYGLDGSARAKNHGALIDTELLLQAFLCLHGKKSIADELDFDVLNTQDARYQSSLTNEKSTETEDDDEFNEYEDYEEKLEAIIEFGYENSWFDADMYEDILDRYRETGFLSDRQMTAIDNVYEHFC